ncbi:MAG: hypothetical protein AB7H96_10295, partial [Vicinamibacterales bacterium]
MRNSISAGTARARKGRASRPSVRRGSRRFLTLLSGAALACALAFAGADLMAGGQTNQAPKIQMSTARALTLPGSLSFRPEVSDDGLPQGATVTTLWTQQSGPGTVTFANPSVRNTSATFSAPGVYVIRLTASDSQLTTAADMTVTVTGSVTNLAPTVSAGPNRTVVLPGSATLSGAVTDDGLPQGAMVTSLWTQQSGPGTTTFANPATPSTTATFSTAGTYVLRLTASDTQLSSFSEVTVTVNNPANRAPVVTAGPTQTVTLPGGATLTGTVTDDGLPQGAVVTSTWTQRSGPGATTFANPSSPATTATFSVAGTYVLRLTASDTQLTAFAEATVIVNAAGPGNQAPKIGMSRARSLTLPGTMSFTPEVTDDGLPQGSTVSMLWTQQSGPGVVTFANPSVRNTSATFSAPGVYVIRLSASDTALTTSADMTVTVTGTPTNVAPTVNAGADQAITLPSGATLSGTVTDDGLPQGATVTQQWTQQSGPGTATFANAASASTGVTFSAAGTYVLRLTADDTALTAFDEVTITVNPAPPTNVAPTVNAGVDQTITLPSGATLTGTVTDDGLPQGASVTSAWTQQSGPGTATFANAASASTGVTFSVAGTYVLRLTADDTALTAFDDVTITVNPAPPTNVAPTVNAGADQTITLPSGATLSGTVTDDGLPQGASVTSAWTQQSGPGTATFANAASASTGVTFSAAGTYVLRLTADDTALTAFDDVTITVNPAPPTNVAPTVNAGVDQTITLPAGATLSGTVTDDGLPQGASVTSAWTQQSGPGTATFANAASASTGVTFSVAGTYVLRLTADDTALTAFDEVTITVNPAPPTNLAPTVNAGVDQTITLPSGATLTGTVTDDGLPQGASVTSAWTQQSGPGTATFANAASASTGVTFSVAGTYVLRLTADDTALTAFDDVTITVNPAPPTNVAPTVNAGADQTITLPSGATLSGTVTDDGLPQGASVTSAWTQQSGPGTATFANAASASTGVTFSAAGTYVLRLTADDTALSAFDEVTITVNPAPPTNVAPTANAGVDQTITLPSGATLSGTVTDDGLPQGASVTSAWTQQSGPGTATFANAASASTGVTFSAAGTYVLRLTADDTALSAFDEVTITVNPAPPTNVAPT